MVFAGGKFRQSCRRLLSGLRQTRGWAEVSTGNVTLQRGFIPLFSSCYAARGVPAPALPNIANMMSEQDTAWMQQALAEARAAAIAGEVPIGAILVRDGEAIARAHNRTITDCDPTAHAEMIALRAAAQVLKNYRLTGATLYVTAEPCAMCAGAMIQARVARVVYGCKEPKGGAAESCFSIFDHPMVNHRVEVLGGVLADECTRVLQEFFQARR